MCETNHFYTLTPNFTEADPNPMSMIKFMKSVRLLVFWVKFQEIPGWVNSMPEWLHFLSDVTDHLLALLNFCSIHIWYMAVQCYRFSPTRHFCSLPRCILYYYTVQKNEIRYSTVFWRILTCCQQSLNSLRCAIDVMQFLYKFRRGAIKWI